MPEDVIAQVTAAERERCAAMLANDAAGLDALLDARLSFHHATGQVDDKTAYLAKMAAGRIQYVAIDWPESGVTALDGAAVMTGKMATKVRIDGIEKLLENRVLAVWVLASGCWRMLAFQSTPLKA